MRISTFFYTIKQGLVNIWKNKMFSLASIATMTACIFLFGLFYSIVTNFQAMVKDAESGVAVTVFFDAGISEQRIEEIGDLIKQRVEVSHCEYISADIYSQCDTSTRCLIRSPISSMRCSEMPASKNTVTATPDSASFTIAWKLVTIE